MSGAGCDLCDGVDMHLICPTLQVAGASSSRSSLVTEMKCWAIDDAFHYPSETRRTSMYYVAAVLTGLSGLFYAAGRHEIGSLGTTMCQYGSPFSDNPFLV